MTWEKSGEDFVESDVIEWTEAIWPPNRNRRKKSRPWGTQKVIAQVAAIDGDFLKLTIIKSEILENNGVKQLIPHKVGSTITKKRATLLRGEPERLLWSEEDVRKAFLKDENSNL